MENSEEIKEFITKKSKKFQEIVELKSIGQGNSAEVFSIYMKNPVELVAKIVKDNQLALELLLENHFIKAIA